MDRTEREIETLKRMISIHCRHNHRQGKLCPDCRKLFEYAEKRTKKCRFGKDKPACADCKVRCYKPDMRTQIRDVMRFSGPRMFYTYPVDVTQHMMDKKSSGKKKMP